MSGHWNYYDDNFDWTFQSSLLDPAFDFTIQKLLSQGLSKEESVKLFNSGFICFQDFDILIDRYYGGAISSFDGCTRLPISAAKNLLTQPPSSSVTVEKVSSIIELKSVIESMSQNGKKLVFRGQNQNYFLEREIKNPYLTIKGYGEVSLLPSIWRRMVKKNPQSFTQFKSLTLFEWSNIFYSAFDLTEIERRHEALNNAGEYVFTMSDMEDCSDELLREFGKFRLDLAMGMKHNLAITLTTLLQHYGLYSPVLDLTESLEVALFFATHKYENVNKLSSYKFIGSNNGQSVLYILKFEKNEMQRHNERDEFLKYLEPQRPANQSCVICTSDRYSINLPALYLEKILVLDFEITDNISQIRSEHIFPGKETDKFLKAISEKLYKQDAVTIFRQE